MLRDCLHGSHLVAGALHCITTGKGGRLESVGSVGGAQDACSSGQVEPANVDAVARLGVEALLEGGGQLVDWDALFALCLLEPSYEFLLTPPDDW